MSITFASVFAFPGVPAGICPCACHAVPFNKSPTSILAVCNVDSRRASSQHVSFCAVLLSPIVCINYRLPPGLVDR